MHLLSVAQFQVLGISVEVRLEVGYGHAVGMLVVYAESAAHIDVLYLDVVSFQLVLQFIDSGEISPPVRECLSSSLLR